MKYFWITLILLNIQVNLYSQTTAPDFTLQDVFGNTHSLYTDYLDQGKYVFLDFFNTTCPPCQYETPIIDTVFRDFGCNSGDIIFLGIETEEYESQVIQFIYEYGMTFPGVSGFEGNGISVFNEYGYLYTPYKIIIEPTYNIISENLPFNYAENLRDSLLNMGFQMQECEGNDFLFFSCVSKNDSVIGEIDFENKSINVILSDNANINDVTPSFINEANSTVFIDNTEQISGETSLDFSQGPMTYEIISETGNSEFWTVYVSISADISYLQSKFEMYPNPSDKFINIFLPEVSDDYYVSITDITGRILLSQQFDSGDQTINLSMLKSGIYFLKLDSEIGQMSKKLLKN